MQDSPVQASRQTSRMTNLVHSLQSRFDGGTCPGRPRTGVDRRLVLTVMAETST